MADSVSYNVGSFVMVFIFLLFLCDIVTAVGGDGRRNISREEYLEVKRKLQSLNRPRVKSIQTENGDIFDCVDINKQPAFDHPLLKNHNIQLWPSSVPNQLESESSSFTTLNIGLVNGGCPDGTVPIRRIQEQDILRANPVSGFGKKIVSNSNGHHYAAKRGVGKFFGIKGTMNLWKPNLQNGDQFSLSQFWLASRTGDINTIEAGWHVDPYLYNGDRTPRMFVYWTADNYQRTGCYNLLCPGFVQVSKVFPVALALNETSVYLKKQYEIELAVYRDPQTGNWWLTYGSKQNHVGYWPNSLFTSLKESGSEVTWGGEIYVTESDYLTKQYPQMGSGSFANEGYQKACYTRKLQVAADDPKNIVFKDFENANSGIADLPQCYTYADAQDPELAPGFFFGGPGLCS